MFNEATGFSLLWPDPEKKPTLEENGAFDEITLSDTGIEDLISMISINERYTPLVRKLLLQLCPDTETIQYRLDVLADLLRIPSLEQSFSELLPMLYELASYNLLKDYDQSPVFHTIKRLGELDLLVRCVKVVAPTLEEAGSKLQSQGLIQLRRIIMEVFHDEVFLSLEKELPQMKPGLDGIASVTIGVNLDAGLKPVEATLISIQDDKFKGSPFISKLFGKKLVGDEYTGISDLYSVANIRSKNRNFLEENSNLSNDTLARQVFELAQFREVVSGLSMALQITLFKDLQRVLVNIVKPIESLVNRYIKINSQFLTNLEKEIAFYLGAARLVKMLGDAGLPMCRPQVAPMEERTTVVENLFNINLAVRKCIENPGFDLSKFVIPNDVAFGPDGRIFILTGPNRGGKTTYIQGLALAHILFQAGLFVPGTQARMSPVDTIYTHFPVEEKPREDAGRLGEESKRISELFCKATRYSLALFNESLSSTSPGEALYIARDIVRVLKLLEVRSVYATHMHDLAADLDELNRNVPGDSLVISLVAGVDRSSNEHERTFRIVVSPPMGRSYARDIARRYGISFEQLTQSLLDRGILSSDELKKVENPE